MLLNAPMSAALDRIAERAADVRRAFTPGAVPARDDVATSGPSSQFTLDPLSAAAPDGTYFVTDDARGRTTYTRDGSFRVRGGSLVDGAGRPIFGTHAPSGALVPLRVDPIDDALGHVSDARIEADGSLAYTRSTLDPRSGLRESQRVVAGRVALARFPAGTKLDSSDGEHFTPPLGVLPHVASPADGSFAPLRPMQRERSRVDIDASLARLKDAYIAFDALQAAETAKGHLGKTAMDLLK